MLEIREDAITNDSPWFLGGSCKVRLVNHTPDLDQTCAYVARVSSKKQDNPSSARLLRYCAQHGHWSVFEQGSMTVEVVAPLAISVQLLRHRSFCFQQFSGRYADQTAMSDMTEGIGEQLAGMFYLPGRVREQDPTNRQNSLDVPGEEGLKKTHDMWAHMGFAYQACLESYKYLIEQGVAKEVARFVLPQGVFTRLYVTGNPRSFIHYINARDDEGVAQAEHVELARLIRQAFEAACPIIAEAAWG